MDQLKEFLGVLKRQHFWILAPILFIVGIFGWWGASKKLDAEFMQNKGTVDRYVQDMQSVSSKQPHPNTEYHEGMRQLIQQREDNIRAAWETKWDRQETELTWPQELPPDFLQQVSKMRPIESVTSSLSARSRRAYANFVKGVLPGIAEQVGAVWNPAARGSGGFNRGSRAAGGEERESAKTTTAVVDWNSSDQAKWREKFNWGDAAPNTKEVLYAQEDLWVLETLFDILRRTNGDVITRAQASIKDIDFIQIGADVDPPSRQSFRVIALQPMEVDGGDDDDGDGAGAGDDDDAMLATPLTGGGDYIPMNESGGAVAAAPDLVVNRYYNKDYEPIADLQSLKQSATVAKRVPVRMRVRMDQRDINKLLVECANAPLTFEVRQLRLLDPRSSGDLLGADAGTGEYANSYSAGRKKARLLADYQTFVRTVELFGIVYIFNPPSDAVLAGEVAEEGLEDDDTAALGPADRWRR